MKMQDLMLRLKDGHNVDDEAIGAIEGDVIGTNLFINILLSLGAFLATGLILSAIVSFLAIGVDTNERNFWIYLTIVAGAMLVLGYMTHSKTSIFTLRLSTYFMILGKMALILLVFERIGAAIGYDDFFKVIKYFAPLALILAAVNMYVGKIKLEIFSILFFCMIGQKLAASHWVYMPKDFSLFVDLGFLVTCGVWVWAIVALMLFDTKYKNRLPFYALLLVQFIVTFFDDDIFRISNSYNYNQVTLIIYNLLLLAPTLYLLFKLHAENGNKLSWQYIICSLLLLACITLPISHLYITMFCFIYGYQFRDRYVLVFAYVFTPLFIYKLYYNLGMKLDQASLLAMIIGISCLAAWAVVRYTKFNKVAG